MKEGLSLNTLIKIEERLDEMGYKSIDDKIEYFEHITTENIDNDIKSLGIISDEDTKGIIKYLSGLKSFGDQIAETISKMPLLNQQNLPNVERQLKPLGDTLGDIIPRIVFSFSKDMLKGLEQWKSMSQKMFAGITDVNIERINREMFLYRLYEHVHGDVSIYEPDIYSVADNWGYTKDEVERFISYFEEKRYVETDRAFGKFLIISVRLTVLGFDHVESENKRGTIGTEM